MTILSISGERVFAKAIAELKLRAQSSINPAPISFGETTPLDAKIRVSLTIFFSFFSFI
jgi:hypothetical protein